MDAKLLQKIEELNLYVIQLEKENKKQDAEIEELLKMIRNIINMKYKDKFVILLVIVTTIGAAGCKKKPCYHCYYYWGGFTAIKNGDSISVGLMRTSTSFHDSINYYLSMGYSIDSIRSSYVADPNSGVEVCDTNSVYLGQPVRDSCAIII